MTDQPVPPILKLISASGRKARSPKADEAWHRFALGQSATAELLAVLKEDRPR